MDLAGILSNWDSLWAVSAVATTLKRSIPLSWGGGTFSVVACWPGPGQCGAAVVGSVIVSGGNLGEVDHCLRAQTNLVLSGHLE